MFAVIQTGGKQYKVNEGDIIYVEKLDAEDGSSVSFDALALSTADGFKVGDPIVSGAKVTAKVVKTGKAKKVVVLTYKAKKNEKTKNGHRQPFTKLQIEKIEG